MELPNELIRVQTGLYSSADTPDKVYIIPSELLEEIEIIETPQTLEVAFHTLAGIYANTDIEPVKITQEILEESQRDEDAES